MATRRFKVGDLVMIKGFYFVVGFSGVSEGQLGLVSEVLEYNDDADRYLDLLFDYVVLVGDEQVLMFDEELESVPKNFKPCSSCGCDPCDCDWGHGSL